MGQQMMRPKEKREMQQAIRSAVVAERKRCIELVRKYKQDAWDNGLTMAAQVAEQIAVDLETK